MGTGFFQGIKRPERGVDQPTPSNSEINGRVELYLYSPSGPSWPVLGWPLPLTFTIAYCLDDQGSNLLRGKRFLSLLQTVQSVSEGQPFSYSMNTGNFFSGVKWPKRKAEHTPSLLSKLRMSGSETPFLYAFMVCRGTILYLFVCVLFLSHYIDQWKHWIKNNLWQILISYMFRHQDAILRKSSGTKYYKSNTLV